MASHAAIVAEASAIAPPLSAPPEATDQQRHRQSRKSLDAARLSLTHQDYLDSLEVPPEDELARIAEVQADREVQMKRRSRDLQRHQSSLDLGSTASAVLTSGTISQPPQLVQPAQQPATASEIAMPPQQAAITTRRKASLAQRLGLTKNPSDLARTKAAIVIQRHYRGYRMRREMKGMCLDANTRWVDALRELQYRELTRPRPRTQGAVGDDGGQRPGSTALTAAATITDTQSTYSVGREPSTARRNWKKVTTIALRAGLDQDSDSDSEFDSGLDTDSSDSDAKKKMKKKKTPMTAEEKTLARQHREEAKAARRREALTMGLQYFLEMVDTKHRYGANLRVYHEEWKRASTHENFFYWLDHGEGRLVDMAACPRDRLEREQVRYLSREERQYYLVRIDRDGRLCWAKNGAHIDTSEKYRDSIHGIVPADDPTPAYRSVSSASRSGEQQHQLQPDDRTASLSSSSSTSSLEVSESELEAARAAKYALGPDGDGDGPEAAGAAQAGAVRKVRHVSATAVLDALLRKSVQKNTWIFVADTSFRLYVGIKDSGTFQHSSFLQGSRISAAGLIRIRNGRLVSLSPLSGHYRPPTANFRAFVQSLKEAGVDTSHVTVSKSYAVLVGLEMYMTTRQRGKQLLRRMGLHRHGEEGAGGGGGEATADAGAGAGAAKKRGTEDRTDGHLLQKLGLRPFPPESKATEHIS